MSENEQKTTAPPPQPRVEEEIEAPDSDFAFVRISEFYSTRKVLFDLYVRLREGLYLRIFRAGENYDESELRSYETDRGMRLVYFKRTHRTIYISSSSALLQKITVLPAVPLRTKFGVARILCELYLQELMECSDEARPALVDKGKELCAVVAAWIDTQADLEKYFLDLDQVDNNVAAQSFLIGLLSCLLSRRMPWKSRRTTETVLFASLLCDIGLSALPPEVLRVKHKRMNPQQKKQYEKHPELSAILLEDSGSKAISENILLVVRQHHEYADGTGYPQGLTGDKTLLLAKLVVLCGEVVRTASENLVSPREGAKLIFPEFTEALFKDNPEIVARFDRELLVQFFRMLLGKKEGTP